MIRKGTSVRWKWGSGHATGEVAERREGTLTRVIDGTEVSRNGSAQDPALLIRQADGQEVVKLQSEVERDD